MAYDFSYNGFFFNFNNPEHTTVELAGVDQSYSSVISLRDIPPSIPVAPNSYYEVTGIGDYAFMGYHEDESHEAIAWLPQTITYIGHMAFSECNLQYIDIPHSVQYIGSAAFQGCNNLTGITIPENVEYINEYTFADCTSLSCVELPSTLKAIGRYAFKNSGLCMFKPVFNDSEDELYTIPQNITAIEEGTFQGCSSLNRLRIPPSIKTIASDAFIDCRLKELNIVDSNEPLIFNFNKSSETAFVRVGFQDCLLSYAYIGRDIQIDLNDSEMSACFLHNGFFSFSSSPELGAYPKVEFGSNVTTIPNYLFKNSSVTEVTLSENITKIGDYTFENCIELQDINLHDGITEIGIGAFTNCYLANLHIPSQLTKIEYSTFSGCGGFSTLEIPENVTSIAPYAFSNCFNVTNIIIPSSVNEIGSYALFGMNLSTVISTSKTPPAIQEDTFHESAYNATLKIPTGSIRAYQAHPHWSNFFNIVEQPIETEVKDVENLRPQFAVTSEGICFLNDFDNVNIYSSEGLIVYSGKIAHGKTVKVAMGHMYLLKIGSKIYKVMP